MEAVILSRESLEKIERDLEEIKIHVKKITVPNESFINNKQFTKLMGVSARTAQTWRNEGEIGFSKEGKKIYYRLSDIENFMDAHYYEPHALKEKLNKLRF